MARKVTDGTEPIFTVTLDHGMASRNRLPLSDVLKFLSELKALVTETGKQIERQRGIESPAGDYGLEILADGSGRFLAKGSVKASIAITRNIEVGAMAISTVLGTIQSLNAARKGPRRETQLQASVVQRLDRLAFINTQGKVAAKFSFTRPPGLEVGGKRLPAKAEMDERTIIQIKEFRSKAVFIENGLTLYGKLFHLRGKGEEVDDENGFWGELKLDSGKRWRVQFPKALEHETKPLFLQQVVVMGTAHYFEKRRPKLVAKAVQQDAHRDYEAAFDELFGSEPHLLGTKTLEQLLAE